MGLLAKERHIIKNDYFRVWDIIEAIYKHPDCNNDWSEVGQFLGHYNADSELPVYISNQFCNIYPADDYRQIAVISELISALSAMWLESDDEAIQKYKLNLIQYYWKKENIYDFKPLMDLGIIEKPPTQAITVLSIQESQRNKYKFFLYKQPLLTYSECACIVADYDPLEIQKLPLEDIDEIVPDYVMALNLISSAVEAGQLNCFNCKITAGDLSEYLQNQNIIIAGFSSQSVSATQNEIVIEENTEKLLYLNDTLTIDEAACIISGDNPADIKYALDNEETLADYKKFLNAQRLVQSAIQLGNLSIYCDLGIATFEFRAFLMMKNLIIKGFNDNQIDDDDSMRLLAEQMTSQSIYISQLQKRIEIYKSSPQANHEQLKLELAQAHERINQLEAIQKSKKLDLDELTPEQEIPNSRQRNNVLRIISILSEMADLPAEPFTAFNMMDAHATQNNKEIPSKHTIADWLKRARDSN